MELWKCFWNEVVRRLTLISMVVIGVVLFCSTAMANPILGNVAAGSATVSQSGNATVVDQTSQQAILNWQSFNIGSHESTHFQQPSGGIALNRINPQQGASQIYGVLTATGKIILMNSAGIYFGPGSYINVGGLIATTSSMEDDDFLNGNYSFNSTAGNGEVINDGTIIAEDHGLVALMGNGVENNGTIQANLGTVALGSGSSFVVTFGGNDEVGFSVGGAAQHGVTNTGTLRANGGTVQVDAHIASDVLDHAINLGGTVEARTVGTKTGDIKIDGADTGLVYVSANINASAFQPVYITSSMHGHVTHTHHHGVSSGQGGQVVISGGQILVDSTADIDVSGPHGGGNIFIGGNKQGQGPLPNAQSVVIASNATLNANATKSGNGGQIVVYSTESTSVSGNLSAQGGAISGNGGYIETSGGYLNVSGSQINTTAAHGTTGMWLLDPSDLTINSSSSTNVSPSGSPTNLYLADNNSTTSNLDVTDLTDALSNSNVTVQTTSGGSGAGSGNITVMSAITWSSNFALTLNAVGDILINAAISGVNGTLNLIAANASQSITTNAAGTIDVKNFNLEQGQWYQVSSTLPSFTVTNNFQIDSGTMPNAVAQFIRATSDIGNTYVITDVYGLQGIGSTISTLADNFQLGNNIDASSTSTWNSGAGFVPIGNNTTAFSGSLNGEGYSINNLTINLPNGSYVGLFGETKNAAISNLGVSGSITGIFDLGGIIGEMIDGTLSNSYNLATITSEETSTINTGGLIGELNGGTLTNVYNSGSISANSEFNEFVGGLVGLMDSGMITNAYNTGNINAVLTTYAGGLVGEIMAGTLSNSYNSGSVVSVAVTGGIVGYNIGTVTDTYNTGTLTINNLGSTAGGLVGQNDGSLSNSYNSGAIITSTTSIGGVVGLNNGTISNSLWDVNTSQQTAGVGTASGTIINLYGGCFGDTCPNSTITNATNVGTNTGLNLALISAYMTAGWSTTAGVDGSITSTPSLTATVPNYTWFIFNGVSNTRPLLLMESTTTVTNAHQLQLIGATLGADDTLGNNIDLSSTTNNPADVWDAQGFIPIGSNTYNFSGSLNGDNHTISNLYINVSANDIGLFGDVNNSNAMIDNLGLNPVSITGDSNVGALVGNLVAGTVNNVYSAGSVNSTSGTDVGGLIGNVGAMGSVSNAYNASTITALSSTNVGGLVGINVGAINNTYDIGTISGQSNVGALVGDNTGTISNSFFDTTVTGMSASQGCGNSLNCSGVSGLPTATLYMASTYPTFDFYSVNTQSNVWYMAGYPHFTFENTPIITDDAQLELINLNLAGNYTISNTIDASDTAIWNGGAGFVPIGTLSSPFTGTLNGNSDAIVNLNINLPNTSYVGLFGVANGATISNLTVTGSVIGSSDIGLLAGEVISSSLSNLQSIGSVTSTVTSASAIGGLIGDMEMGLLSSAYSGADVTAGNSSNSVGGLIGIDNATTTNVYSTGSVTVGQNAFFVGGLTGVLSADAGSITNSYASGALTAGIGSGDVGGLVGLNSGTISASFWDTITSGQNNAVGDGTGTLTNVYGGCFTGSCSPQAVATLSALANYTTTYPGITWSIGTTLGTDTWVMFDGATLPMLSMEYNTAISTPHQLQLAGLNTTTLDATYTLTSNINLASTNNGSDVWGSAGFIPIGNSTNNFLGNLNGQGYTISNLYINNTNGNSGLFGVVNEGVSPSSYTNISNLGLIDPTIISGNQNDIGTLIGQGGNLNVSNVYASNVSLTTTGGLYIGGLIGAITNNNCSSGCTLSNIYTTGNITTTGTNVGGIAGYLSDVTAGPGLALNSAWSNATISAGNISGGLVGYMQDYTSINNAYFNGAMTNNTAQTVGGIVGQTSGNASVTTSINDTYSSGYIASQNNFQVGGLVGLLGQYSSILNSYWDTATSGTSVGVGAVGVAPVTDVVTAGTFDGSAGVNLSLADTFTGWDFSATWGILANQSYPYLLSTYPQTPRVISGLSNAAAAANATLAVNGSVLNTISVDNNGFYYFIEANNVIPDNALLLTYISGSTTDGNAIAFAPVNGGSLSGTLSPLNLVSNTVTVGTTTASTLSNSALSTAKGSLSDTGILYSIDNSNDLTLAPNGTNFSTTAATSYNLDGSITTTNANITFNGPVTLSNGSQTLTTNTTGNILLLGALNNVTLGMNTLTINSPDTSNLIEQSIIDGIGGMGSLITSGTGILTLTGTNTYSGTTTVNAGTLQIGNGSTTGTLGEGNVMNNAALIFDRNDNGYIVANDISGNGTLTQAGSGTLTITSDNTYSGNTYINNGVLQIGNGGSTGTLGNSSGHIIDNTTLIFNRSDNATIGNAISGSGNLIKQTVGMLTLSGSNSYTGSTMVDAGTLQIASNNALGNGVLNTSGVTVQTGASLDLYTSTSLPAVPLTLNGTGVSNVGALQSEANLAYAGNILLNTDSSLNTNNRLLLSGTISGNGALTSIGTGILTLSGNNNYMGATTINAGTVIVTSVNGLGIGSAGINIAPASSSNAILDLSALLQPLGNTGTISLNSTPASSTAIFLADNAYTLTNPFNLTGTNNQLNVNTNGNLSLTGLISGSGALITNGVGTLELVNPNNDYTGQTSINAGTIIVTKLSLGGMPSSLGSTAASTPIVVGSNAPVTFVYSGGTDTTDRTMLIGANGAIISLVNPGTLTWNGNINGNATLALNGAGNVTLGGQIGNITPLTTFTSNVNTTINNIDINTLSSQIYNAPVSINGMAVLTMTNTGGNNAMAFNAGLSGNSLQVIGNGGNDSFYINTTNAQQWTLTSNNDAGTIAMADMTNPIVFTEIQNLTGGSNNNIFTLAGYYFAGNINGGISGNNTLNTNNVASTWHLIGTNAGSVTDLTSFSNIQNLNGGNAGNDFIFANGANITGLINGGSTTATNTLNYNKYAKPISIYLSQSHTGSANNQAGANISTFENINHLTGNTNNARANIILVPGTFSIIFNSPGQGIINGTTTFNGFNLTSNNPVIDVSPILQPKNWINSNYINPITAWIALLNELNIDLSQMIQQESQEQNTSVTVTAW